MGNLMMFQPRIQRCVVRSLAIVLIACPAILGTSRASASIVTYNFNESGSGDVLAVLQLSALPASPAEINSLTFTAAGDAIFGFGVGAYSPGNFEEFSNDTVIAEGLTGLMGTGSYQDDTYFTDNSNPTSSIGPVTTFEMAFQSGVDADYLLMDIGGSEGPITRLGNWQLATPEPTALLVWSVLAGVGGLACGRRRRLA
jgi:hypothetical protein